jgi:hypothetical protein
MKNLKLIFIYVFILVILTTIFACSGKPLDYYGAVEKVSTSATQLTITKYATFNQITLEKGNPAFDTVLEYLEKSVITREQPRFVKSNGEKLEVAIPYAIGFILKFHLSDNSEVTFDYGSDKVWFNTEDMIYGASVKVGLYEVLDQLFS